MFRATLVTILLLCIACNNNGPDTTGKDTIVNDSRTTSTKNEASENADTTLMNKALQILSMMEDQRFQQISIYFHPKGVRFSPYGHIDTNKHLLFSVNQFRNTVSDTTTFIWGEYDGSGEPIKMNFRDYYKKFIYDQRFFSAPQKAVNKILGHGNSLINIDKVFPGSDFVEFHFRGTEKYGGMDWKSLRLVFQRYNNEHLLVAIIHDQWTI